MASKFVYLYLYKNNVHFQTITYLRDQHGWRAVHFDRDKYMPIQLHQPLEKHKADLEKEQVNGITYEWVHPPDDAA